MKHRHCGKVKYTTSRGRVAFRARPLHNISRAKVRKSAWTIFSNLGADEIDPDYISNKEEKAGMKRLKDGIVLDTYDLEEKEPNNYNKESYFDETDVKPIEVERTLTFNRRK